MTEQGLRSSLRLKLAAWLALGLIALWGAVGFELHRLRESHLGDARVSVVLQAQIFAENNRTVIKRLDEVLIDLREHWSGDEKEFTRQVQRQGVHISDIAFQIGVIGKDGFLAYTNLKRTSDKVDLSDREHFKVHASGNKDSLFISKPLKGKVSGRWTIQFTRPIFIKDHFSGVIVLSVSPDSFVDVHEQLNLGANGALALVAESGIVMARFPDSQEHVGKSLSGTPYLDPGSPVSGYFTRIAQIDGIERIYGYYKLEEYGLNFVVGQSVPDLMARYREQRNLIVAAALLVSLCGMLLAIILYQSQLERNQTAQKLQASEERYKRLTSLTPVGIILHDGAKILDVNPAFCTMYGYESQELVGQPFSLLLTEEARETVREKVDAKSEDPYEVEGLRKDGTTFPMEICGKNVVYEGQYVRVASAIDLTDKKRAEEALRASEERYHNLFSGSKVPMLLIDPEGGRIIDGNMAACEFYGYDQEQLKSKTIGDINILTRGEVEREMQLARQQKRSHFHFRHRLASGEIRDVEVHSGPIKLAGKTILYSMIHDETVRRRLELEHRKLVRAIEQSPVSVMITNANAEIEYVNPRFLSITGFAIEEILGKNPRILKSGKTPDETYQQLWEAIRQGQEWHGELCNKKKNGELYWEQASISCITDSSGLITHYLGVKEDITERRRITEELARSHAELEQFAYVASHDLRQPLRMVTSYLQLVEKHLGKDLQGDVKEFMDFALGGAKRMDKLIVSLLDYSRTGRNDESFGQVDLAEVVGESLKNLEVAVMEAGAEISVAKDLPTVSGHWVELVRLFQNLVGNAIKYRHAERSPRIDISFYRDGQEYVVVVADNGMGMDPKDHKRAFAIFQRLVSNQQYEGTGIGLAVCKKIVEHHKGRIWIESAIGEGCKFYVALPVFDV
jgi:PAS domain S-box-containing protein